MRSVHDDYYGKLKENLEAKSSESDEDIVNGNGKAFEDKALSASNVKPIEDGFEVTLDHLVDDMGPPDDMLKNNTSEYYWVMCVSAIIIYLLCLWIFNKTVKDKSQITEVQAYNMWGRPTKVVSVDPPNIEELQPIFQMGAAAFAITGFNSMFSLGHMSHEQRGSAVCVIVSCMVGCISYVLMSHDVMPWHITTNSQTHFVNTARLAEWLSLVWLIMAMMHGLYDDDVKS
eukprot:g135.t1